jgi:hypothetical protein
LNGFSYFLLGKPQLIETLEIQPELRARTEKMSEAQCRVARDGPCSVQYLRHAIGRNVDLPCQFSRTYLELLELLGEVFAGVDCGPCQPCSSMIIGNARTPAAKYSLEINPRLPLQFPRKVFINQ